MPKPTAGPVGGEQNKELGKAGNAKQGYGLNCVAACLGLGSPLVGAPSGLHTRNFGSRKIAQAEIKKGHDFKAAAATPRLRGPSIGVSVGPDLSNVVPYLNSLLVNNMGSKIPTGSNQNGKIHLVAESTAINFDNSNNVVPSMEVGKVSNHPFSNLLVTTLHINPNFEGSVKFEVPINNGLLDPAKHSAITFKDYSDLNIINWEGGSSLGFKIRGSGSKRISIRSGRNLNRTIKGHGGRFKVASNSRVPLADAMNSMVELISDQIGMDCDTDSMSAVRDIQKEPEIPKWWRCANRKFPCIFHEYNYEHKPDIVGLLETRVSGSKEDLVIAKLGFKFSHCVELIGFF
ncbi:hypothetical protein Gogos_001075 [Gossypium gossypioides]|uniref:Uncharacterized protein n=1 Tax=Gossypium gossypioides TaxID=34282 RepID=A0A7J9CV27_GOSGO|nr:hypothetical protein [Gossypium gossypioides]